MGKLPKEFLSWYIEYESGASEKFEEICTELMQAKYGTNAHRISPRQGDLGIDVIIGTFPFPFAICQCKFFPSQNIGKAQKDQIRKSFNRAASCEKYSTTKWILFLANDMDPQEFDWWSSWRKEQMEQHKIEIELCEGTNLISSLKEYKIYDRFFAKQVNGSLHENTLGSFGGSGLFLIDDKVIDAHDTPGDSRIVRAFRRISTELETILYAVCSGAASECILEGTALTLVDHLVREIDSGSQMILLLGNGGIGKTTALVQTAVRMRASDRIIYLLQLGKPQDTVTLEEIRQSVIRNKRQNLNDSYLLFIDNPYANSEVLGDFLNELQFEQNVQIIISERLNRFSSIADELLCSIYRETLRIIRVGFTKGKGIIPFAHNRQVVKLQISASWKRQIVLDMFRSIPDVDISKVESVISGGRGMSIIELYLRTCIQYNGFVNDQENLSTLVRVKLDWDEWTDQIKSANLTTQESEQLESVFQIVAALDLFKVKANLTMLSNKTGIPEDRLDSVFRSLLNKASCEPMWYDNSGDTPYLQLKHDVISYLYFEKTGFSPQITLESLIGTLQDRETIISFEKQVFKRRYIQPERGSGPPFNINVKKLYKTFAGQTGFYDVLLQAGRAYSFDVARIWMIDVHDRGVSASESWSALLQDYADSEPMLRRKVYLCCRDDCQRRGIPVPEQLLPDDDFQYTEAFEAAKAGTDMTLLTSIWSDRFDSIYRTAVLEEDIVFEWRKGFFDYILTGIEMPGQFFDVLNHVSYQVIDAAYSNFETYVKRNRLDMRRYYDLGVSLYAAIVERNPADIPSRMHLAYCYKHLGNYRQAELIYQAVLRDYPAHYTAHNALAALCVQWLKEQREILEEEEKRRLTALFETSAGNAIDFAEDDIDKACGYAVWGTYLFRTVRKYQESYEMLQTGLNYCELHSLHIELGMLCSTFSNNNPCYSVEEAERHFKRALELDCRPIERLSAHVPYGNMLYYLGKFEEAIAQYRQASKLGESKADWMMERIRRESQILEKVEKHPPHLITTLEDAIRAIKHNKWILSDMEKRLDVFSVLLDAVSGESIENADFFLISFAVTTLGEARYPRWREDLIKFRIIQKTEEFCAKSSFYAKRAQDNFRVQCLRIHHSIQMKPDNVYDIQLEEYGAHFKDISHAADPSEGDGEGPVAVVEEGHNG